MRVPDLEALRPGDFVKVRGNPNPLHTGGRAVVVAVHRQDGPPWRVVALDLRYSATSPAVRVDVADSGELARWETPWAPKHTVEDEPEVRELLAAGAAHVESRTPRRTLVVAGLAALAVVAGVGVLEHQQRPAPNPVVVQRALAEGARGTAGATPVLTATPTATPTRVAATASVVAYAAGPVPVVAGADGTRPTPLAGLAEAPGCHDAYVADLFSYLPVGQAVDVAGAGWYRTDDGLDVNAELVRQGVAVPVATTAGSSTTDTRNYAQLTELAADAPHC
ncbi:hypothetical protein [Kineococcus rhizosphaerae]|uniref:Uncharacterized protein n=1 Tax=Kineococcus rhizosphaerae TaxID=559628 RepID=A0A2T0R282_9ACTN|nr:hypothetical protein [Kineococcus rhizosphaerae]PRY13918.1 hypothetical protein CLV37_10736 [Kineococcus rhizosphaerae]